MDDSEGIVRLVSEVLRTHGYRVLTAADGARALRVLDAHRGSVHLVLTDVVMPEVGGMELALQVRRSRADARLLFMTGYAPQEGVAEEIRESGARLLEKPFTPEQLLAKVREALS